MTKLKEPSYNNPQLVLHTHPTYQSLCFLDCTLHLIAPITLPRPYLKEGGHKHTHNHAYPRIRRLPRKKT